MSFRRWCSIALAALLLPLAACAPNPDETAIAGPEVTMAAPGVSDEVPETSREPEPTATELEPETTPEPEITTSPTVPAQTATPEVESHSPLLAPGQTSEQIRELQHRLLQISWLSGEITDTYDQRTQSAVDGFQSKRGLPVLGHVDQETWDRLLDMTRTPTHDELHNVKVAGPPILERGDSGSKVRELQARLKQISWFHDRITDNYGPVTQEAVRGFQAKRGLPVTGAVDQDTLDALHAMTRQPTTAELADEPPASGTEPAAVDARCLTGRVVCVSKSNRQLAWVVDGQVQFTADVRFGSELTPTREGVFSVGWKSRDHVSSIYHSPMPFALFFSGGQAVHFSDDFRRNGYNGASYGCVNLRDKDVARTLFETTRVGDKVIVY